MLYALVVGALSFQAPSSLGRRDFLRVGAGSAAAAVVFPLAANAAVPIPKAANGIELKEAMEAAKEYKYAARPTAGNEPDNFKAAEAKRVEAKKRLDAGIKPREETAAETMARLGLKAAS